MSVVTAVTLIAGFPDMDEEPLRQLNGWLAERGYDPMADISDYYRGGRHPECGVYGAGYNWLDDDEFAEFAMGLDWESPADTVLVLRKRNRTRVFRPFGYEVNPA